MDSAAEISDNQSRKRTARACDSCYKRKRCRSAIGADIIISLALLTEYSPSSSGSQPPASVAVHFAGRELGVISLLTGIPFLLPEGQKWIESRTGQPISVDKLTPIRPPWEKERAQSTNELLMSMQAQKHFELPEWAVVQSYYQAFLNSNVVQRIFPIIDAVLFQETMNAAYHESYSHFSYGQAGIRACMFAFVAFVSRLPPVKSQLGSFSRTPIDSEAMATKAEFLLAQVLQEPASLEGIQTVTLLTLFELASGNMRAASYYGAIAARLLFMLGGNLTSGRTIRPSDERSQRKRRHIRNLFWICYTVDKDVALRTGQPPTISDENCDLTLPEGYMERLWHAIDDENSPYDQPVFPFDLRLSIIKSRAHTALYSVSSLQKSDAELLKAIRELDDELEQWRLSVPPEWRPTMSFKFEAPDPTASMHSVMVRLNYHLCMTIIHQASSRCKAWVNAQSGIMEGVSSSLALSVEASRSTLSYLEAAEHVLVDGIFWTLIFYPMSALLAIFCNILQNPLDPQSRKDLDLLKIASGMVERVFSRQLSSVKEVVHLKLVANFVVELKQLAGCAIEKAWAERSAGSRMQE
ncbi:uncharacterized protein PFLUO_LOCUS4119 [Penicillium psychrofluorescens]|uniref:uncharacterized protein n=1 Tax=Penicillium psychrofluorescens TaxID=3158075 RepID=UPI003CCD4C30